MALIHGLHFNNLRGDIYGGLTAAVVALPLAMAMGVASGAGPVAGLYGAIFVGFFAALFGGTPAQVSGPTGPMTVVMAAIFLQYTSMFPDDPAHGAALAFTVVMLGGLFQIILGLLRWGKYIELVPHPVVSGFMSGIGVIIILLQFGPMLGHATVSKPVDAAQAIPGLLQNINSTALVLALITLLIVYGVPSLLPRLNRLIPSPLLALIAGTVGYVVFLAPGSTPIIGTIPTGIPELRLPTVDTALAMKMVASAITLAGLGAIDSLLTSLVADNVTRTLHRSNRELIGQGIGNTVAGLFGGLPGAGATMRTMVNVKAGGRTPISGALHALVLLAIVLGAGSLASNIPKAVLAGILIKVGTDIIDWSYLKRLQHLPKAGVAIMLVVLIVTVTIDLLLAVGIGMVMASFLFMQRMTDLQIKGMSTITQAEEDSPLSAEEAEVFNRGNERIMLFHLSGPMSFSSAKSIVRRHTEAPDYDIMLLDLTDTLSIDYTSARAMEDVIADSLEAECIVYLVGARPEVRAILDKQQVTQRLDKDFIYAKRIDALHDAVKRLEEKA
ncbi:Sulfate permease [hydrothermal vent metagenome]|uniref:Sulfate permease n=1 Tax=hydrothermal vent metagenome TaxID=652676 RepID=A0A3B0YMF8_9ZZZZ